MSEKKDKKDLIELLGMISIAVFALTIVTVFGMLAHYRLLSTEWSVLISIVIFGGFIIGWFLYANRDPSPEENRKMYYSRRARGQWND